MSKAPLVRADDFRILVVPKVDVVQNGLTIPMTYQASGDGMIRSVACADNHSYGCSFWAMKNKKAVSAALRQLADYIDSGGA